MKNYRMDARITYDGKEVVFPGDEPLFMTVGKKSDHMVSMYCGTKPGLDITMGMSIPEVSLSGAPYNVNIDYLSNDAAILFMGRTYHGIDVSVKGWIRNSDNGTNGIAPRTSPAILSYLCDIVMESTVEGKVLKFAITSACPGR